MISDILCSATHDIEDYERDDVGYRNDAVLTSALGKVKTVMDAMRHFLDGGIENRVLLDAIANLDVSQIESSYHCVQEMIDRRMQNTGEDRETAAINVAKCLEQR